MQQGRALDKTDHPETLDPVRKKNYRMIIVNIQFLAYWCRFDCSFTEAQLA